MVASRWINDRRREDCLLPCGLAPGVVYAGLRGGRPVRAGFDLIGADDGGIIGAVTLLKVSWLRIFCLLPDVSGETLALGIPDRTMAALLVSLTLWGHRLVTYDAWSGLLVERCFIYRVDSGGSQRHGVVGSR